MRYVIDKDTAEGKLTYVTLLGVTETKERIEDLTENSHQILDQYNGEAAAYLRDMTDRIAVRTV